MKSKQSIVAVFMVTFIAIIAKISAQDDSYCIDPDRFPGVCKHIKECPIIFSELMAKNSDAAFVQYLRNSNIACRGMNANMPLVCCPPDGRKYQIPDVNVQGRLLTPIEGCGFSNQELRIKLASGHQARLGAFPWMALIGYTSNSGTSWGCGGTLITTRHVLTAARCVTPNLSFVRLGEHSLNSTTERGVEDVVVTKSDQHFDYNPQDGSNDIAILYLEKDVNISPYIRPICLPISDPIRSRDFVNYQPFVAGWGRSQTGGHFDTLHEAILPVLANEECEAQYRKRGKLSSAKQFSNAVICAGILDGNQDNCINDVGGPLSQPIFEREFEEFRYYLIGVASNGVACERTKSDTPIIFAKVQHFIYWIQDKVNGVE